MHSLLKPRYSSKSTLLFLTLLFILSTTLLFGQEQIGRPLITNYSYQDYQGNAINWWAEEDAEGIMYFANGGGVLQYDGVNWNMIDVDGGTRCLVYDDQGVLYVGKGGDLGYLDKLANGEYKYISLKDKIPEEYQDFQEIWEVDYYKGRVIFRATNHLYCWDGETMKVIPSEDAYHVGNIVNGVYYLRLWNKGLCYLTDEDTFELVPGGEQFTEERIYTILPYDDKRVLLGTRTQGFFIFDGENYEPFKTEIDEQVGQSLYLPGVALPNGNFLLNTFSNGAYLIDHQGKLIQKYTTENGLQDGAVDFAYLDSRNVLWLVLFNGISSIDLNTSLTIIDNNMGLPSNIVFAIQKYKNRLYVGTNNGFYYINDGENKINHMEGTLGQATDFTRYKDRLYAVGGDMGLIEIEGSTWKYVKQSINYDLRANGLLHSEFDENRLYVMHNAGFASFYLNEDTDQFEMEGTTDKINLGIAASLAEDSDGNLWLDPTEDGEIEVFVPTFVDGRIDWADPKIDILNQENGLPETPLSFWKHDDEIHFFSWLEEADSLDTYAFDKETRQFNKAEFYYRKLSNIEGNGALPAVKDSEGKLWFRVKGQIVISQKDEEGNYEMNTSAFKELKTKRIWGIIPEDPKPDGTQIVWMNSPDGVYRYKGKMEKSQVPDFKTLIRSVKMAGDSLLFAGGIDFPEKLEIAFDQNTINIGYAAPFFISQGDILYKTYLEGLDKDWSDWGKQTAKEYINLPAGKYSFKVKAKNLFGDETEEAIASFNIIPPWYKTWWAYALYVLGLFILVYAIVRSRTNILLNQQKVLENKVQERTREAHQRLNELATVNEVSQALTQKLELSELIQLERLKARPIILSVAPARGWLFMRYIARFCWLWELL